MPTKAGVKTRIPEDLIKKVIFVVYQLTDWGLTIKDIREVVEIIEENYWRDKDANKSGS